ncbi:MAG: Gfo/Idh/MocA family protein [Planctomycetota bacterium]|jgi:predicted dehydrogenase
MKTWNFGIVGAGLIAGFHARAIKDIPNASLISCYDVDLERSQKLAQKYSCRAMNSLEEILGDKEIDIVTIATPSGAHMEPAIAAAEFGKHVICEKPLEITLERIDAMIHAHEQAGSQLGGIFQYRYCDAIKQLKEAVDSGRFGTITYAGIYVPWWRTDEYYKDSWHGTWALDGGGALMNQSIHMVDLLCYLMPPVESVQAFTSTLGHPQIEAEDTAVANLKFTNGTLGIIYGTTASYPGQFKRLEITGTKGTVVYLEDSFTIWQFAEEESEDKDIREKFRKIQGQGSVANPAAITHQNHTLNFESFIKALEEKKDFEINALEARKPVELILAIYKSAKEQKLVNI